MTRAFVAMGSNLGDRWAHLGRACAAMADLPGTKLARLSPVYETAPVGGPAEQGAFLNAVAELETQLEPADLLQRLHKIEQEAGRPARAERVHWGPRPLDLDLLLFADRVIDQPGLTVPHPRLHERWFVLRPLADLNPNIVHPLLNTTVAQLLHRIEPDRQAKRHAPDAVLNWEPR